MPSFGQGWPWPFALHELAAAPCRSASLGARSPSFALYHALPFEVFRALSQAPAPRPRLPLARLVESSGLQAAWPVQLPDRGGSFALLQCLHSLAAGFRQTVSNLFQLWPCLWAAASSCHTICNWYATMDASICTCCMPMNQNHCSTYERGTSKMAANSR